MKGAKELQNTYAENSQVHLYPVKWVLEIEKPYEKTILRDSNYAH